MLNSNLLSSTKLSNYIITSPPGSGKTTAAMDFLIKSSKPWLKIYLVPFKSLADEVYSKFRQKADTKRVVITTGDYKEPVYLQDNDILVATSEKFLSLLTDRKIKNIDKIVIDEFQLLNSDRGGTIEQILVNMRFYPEATVLLLSGTMSNPEEISGWLGGISNRRYEIIREKNTEKVKIEIIDNFYEHEKNNILNTIIRNNQNKQGIIFFNTKAKTMQIGKMFGKEIIDCSEFVDDYFSCPCIFEDMGFHNSSLYPDCKLTCNIDPLLNLNFDPSNCY